MKYININISLLTTRKSRMGIYFEINVFFSKVCFRNGLIFFFFLYNLIL